MSEIKYKISETTLEAEWKKSNSIGSSFHYCSNCHDGRDGGYPPRAFRLGKILLSVRCKDEKSAVDKF